MEKSDSTTAVEVESPVAVVKVTDQERELANHAQVEFESKHYDSCLATLGKLAEIRKNDSKVQHNRVVAQYYQSNLFKTDEFSKNLLLLRKQVDRDAEESHDEVDDVDTATLLYNEAVLHFHLRQYKKAEKNLQRLNKVIEPIDEHLACKIGLLLIEVYLTLWKPDKASAVIAYLENMIFGSSKPSEVQQGQGQVAQATKEVDENLKTKLHQYKARLNILAKSMKACKREIKTVMNNNNMTPEALFLKSNFEYLRQNYRKSIKQLNSAPKEDSAVRETGEPISTMYYNNLGCIHFQMHKYNLAAFYFRRALEQNDKTLMSFPAKDKNNPLSGRPLVTVGLNLRHEILYNLGLQLLFSGRPLAAFDCLVDAVQRYHTNPRLWLRLAECCIMAQNMSGDYRQQSIKKSDIVQAVVGLGPHRKIVLNPQDEKKDLNAEQTGVNHSAAMPACTLEFAWICLQNALLLVNFPENNTTEQETVMEAGLNKDEEGIGHSMDSEGSGDSGGQGRTSPLPREPSISAHPGPPVKLRELPHLKSSILACSSFVALGLGDDVMALQHAQNLLLQPDLSGSLRFLGHLYAAEALVKLGRVADAITHLAPENLTDLSASPTATMNITEQTGQEKSNKENSSASDREHSKPHGCNKLNFPKSLSEGRAILLLNLASTYCLRSDYEKARKCLQQALSLGYPSSQSAHGVLLAVYIELQCGNVSGALQTIKKHQVLQLSQQRPVGKSKKFLV